MKTVELPTVKIACDSFVDNCHDSHEIEVTCKKITTGRDGNPVANHTYLFRALIGDVVFEHGMAVGPVSGEFITPTLSQLQKDVDEQRLHAAKHAHMRHIISELEEKLK